MYAKGFSRTDPDTLRERLHERLQPASPVSGGILAGTLVETPAGWQPVETLRIGGHVHTLDGGPTRVLALNRRIVTSETKVAVIHVPGGHFDACSDLILIAGQHVLIETLDEASPGAAPYIMVPARALTSDPMVSFAYLEQQTEVIIPLFAEEEAIFVNTGVLLHCPSVMDGAGRFPENSFFPRLDSAIAHEFLKSRAARLSN